MFANLKKKIEEGVAVSPVVIERKTGSGSTVTGSTPKTQSLASSYVHGAGQFLLILIILTAYFIVLYF